MTELKSPKLKERTFAALGIIWTCAIFIGVGMMIYSAINGIQIVWYPALAMIAIWFLLLPSVKNKAESLGWLDEKVEKSRPVKT